MPLPCSFIFASSKPNWGSDSRTLRGEENESQKTPHLSLQHSLESLDEAFPEPAKRARNRSGEFYRLWSRGGLGNPRSRTRAGGGGRGPKCVAASGKTLSQRQPHVAPAPTCHPKGQRVTRVSGGKGSSQCGPSEGQDRTPGGGQSAQQRERLCSAMGGLAGKAQGWVGVPLPRGPRELLQHPQTESPGLGAQGARGAPSHVSPQAPSKAPPSPNFKHQVLFASYSIVLSLGLDFYG